MPKSSAPTSQMSRRYRYNMINNLRNRSNRRRNGDHDDLRDGQDMQIVHDPVQEVHPNIPPQQDERENFPEAEAEVDEVEVQLEAADNNGEADSEHESIVNADEVHSGSDREGQSAESDDDNAPEGGNAPDDDIDYVSDNEGEDDDDDSDDSEEDHGQLDNFGNLPFYTGAFLSVRESAALVFTLMLNHGLSHSCVDDILTVLHLHSLSQQRLVKLHLYKLKRYFSLCSGPVNKKYYCSECYQSLASLQEMCGVCSGRKPVSYFIQMPLIPQLKKLFARPNFYHDLQHRFNREQGNEGLLKDIFDGRLYREQVHQGFLTNPQHFSMTYFTDGVPVFKSKNYSFWGFQLTINELPYRQRVKRENTLMAGLWVGSRKPDANLFMNSFIDDFRKIYQGFSVFAGQKQEQIIARGIVLGGVADTPVRSTFINCVHHNGFYGCPCCEIRGETVRLPGGSNTHAYRYERDLVKRTTKRMFQHARQAFDSNAPVKGVKGLTSLRLFVPDFVRGTGIDVMHLLVGIVRKFIMLLFDSKYSAEGFSLRAVLGIADDQLLAMKPPKFIHRMPRSLADVSHWKPSELRTWFFYYSIPILQDFMRPMYFDHYLTLVIAISYLNASCVSLTEIDKAEELLHEFVQGFENLYGLQFCSINIHMLLHLPDCVKEMGPLHVYSCFAYEDINGQILKTIHGKTDISLQVSSMHWFALDLHSKLHFLRDGPIKDFCLRQRKQVKIGERLFSSCCVVGQYTDRETNNLLIMQCLQRSIINFTRFKVYFRLLKDGLLYVSEKYRRNEKSNSSFVSLNIENGISYGRVFAFVKTLQCHCDRPCNCIGQHFAIVKMTERVSEYNALHHPNTSLKYMHKCRMTMNIIAVPVENLRSVCFHMSIYDRQYIAEPVNKHEV